MRADMKFENFSETHEKGKRAKEQVKAARVSEGTRQMARDPSTAHIGQTFPSFDEEYNALIAEKKLIEADLANYTKTAYLSAQSKIRHQHGGIGAWIRERERLDAEKKKLTDRLHECEAKIAQIKGRAKQERMDGARRKRDEENRTGVFQDILQELRAIRSLLESRVGQQEED